MAAEIRLAADEMPQVDGFLRICELVRFHLGDVEVLGAAECPAALELQPSRINARRQL